jgi:hypothetical protein
MSKDDVSKTFQADFLICNISETAIIGRPFLDHSGLMHLLITSETAPNPFECNQVTVEHLAIHEDEDDDEPILSVPSAFDETTTDLWEDFAKQFGVDSKQFFKIIHFAATNTSIQVSKILQKFHELKSMMPSDYSFEHDDITIERKYHVHAPWKEVNKAVFTIQNVFNTIWNIRRLGLANFPALEIDFDWEAYKAPRMNCQNLNPVMRSALEGEWETFTSAGLMEEIPADELASKRIALSPQDIIRKKEANKFRCVTDYKRSLVNKHSKRINYASPVADEHLDAVAGKDILSIADAKSFFWQLPLHINSRNIVAFFTQLGARRYCSVPQGHTNAGTHAYKVTNESFRAEEIMIFKAYYDDISNGSKFRMKEGEQYWDFMIAMIEFHAWALRKNVRFDPKDAQLGYCQIELLGFTCNNLGKSISASRTIALKELPVPDSKQMIMHFLGCFVFVAKYIKDFAAFAAPLYSMLNKGIRFEQNWGEEQIEAIANLKKCIDRAPILKVVQYDIELFFRSDGSIMAVSAVLFQFIEGKEMPACYGSKVLSKTQRGWPIVQIEFFAIICFIRKWKPIMQGHSKIIIEMDARNLLWARTSSNEMIRRWIHDLDGLLEIAEMRHVPGISNQPSDALSRCLNIEVEIDQEFGVGVLENVSNYIMQCSSIVEEVQNWCGNILESIEKIKSGSENTKEEDIDIQERYSLISDEHELMSKEIHQLISLAHNDIIGHSGVSGTVWVMRRANLHSNKCFKGITHMTKCIECFIKTCPTCQLTHLILPSRYPTTDMVTHEFFQIVDIDFCFIGLEKNGYQQILGVRDRLTRYCEIFPCKTSTVEEFAPHLLAVGGRYGFMSEICMDNPDYFVNSLVDELLILLGADRKEILHYRPQANPMERSNKEILRHIRALVLCRPEVAEEWAVYIPIVMSIVNGTFNSVTHTTPTAMIYGDRVNRLRGILTRPGEPKIREELGPDFAKRVSKGHAMIMAAAEEYQLERIRKCLDMQPAHDMSKAIAIGDYVTAVLPPGMRKPKIQAQFRGIYLVVDLRGDNGSIVRCQCPVENTVREIHADQLRILDLRILQQSEEITAWAAKLLNIPEYVVTDISNHRFASTRVHADFSDRDLPDMEFLCHYKLPPPNHECWNRYQEVSNLKLLDEYIKQVRSKIPIKCLNGKDFEDCSVIALKHFCKTYQIIIEHVTKKSDIIEIIRNAIADRN